jgi:hypothetical protein
MGRFEEDDPDKRFRVLAGSGWRKPVLNPEATTYELQVKVGELQDELVAAGVLDAATMTFTRDHVFDNWTLATRVISGRRSTPAATTGSFSKTWGIKGGCGELRRLARSVALIASS